MSEQVTFTSATGPTLAGVVDVPEGEARGWGVFAHGFTLGKDCPAAIAAAHDCPTVEAVATVAAPFQPAHVEHNYDALVHRIQEEGEAPFHAGGKALTLKRQFVDDARLPRSFVSLEGANHLLTGKNQAARAGRIISAWADPYL